MQRRDFLKFTALGVTGLAGFRTAAASAFAPAAAFSHPGLLHTAEELAFVKAKIEAGEEPWKSAWVKLLDADEAELGLRPRPHEEVVRGPSNNPDIGSSQLSHDCEAAYTHAVQWCMTGNRAHAEQAVTLINAWSATFKLLSGHDTKLLSGMTGIKFCNAAELLRHTYDGWAQADQQRFETMLRDVFYEPIKDFYPTANGNWDASMIQTMLAMGVFLNDRAMFDRACNYYLKGEGNGAIENYFNEFGQCQESGRDQAHTQMGLGFLGCAAEMAWKQGVDLYSAADNRLALGFEYTAKYNLGYDVPYETYRSVEGRYTYRSISDDSRGRFAPIYERAVYHYHHRLGMEMPYCREVVERARTGEEGQGRRGRRRTRRSSHVPWGNLMFAELPNKPD